ncbi:MAG: iron-containing alcohol dehydrogenase [Oscillospiraceae bacterium]|jgi:alcohol dehydrogenase YqhD (iron-dependent ADH family)|nr:iron-containing alcohol dehydrogenase [Oscillospiraceae bacterium]
MINFQYYNPAKIVFGSGSIEKLGCLLKEANATSLLLVYSGDFIKELGIYESVANTCRELGVAFYENGDVVPNPSIELVRKLSVFGKEIKVDFVLAVGGGSAIDTAKAVALGIPYAGDVWDFFEKGILPDVAVPVGVISTLPASGSETSNCAILSNGEWKLGFEDDKIIPKFAIMDPEYTLKLPEYQTACGVADILSHLLERYFSDVKHTDVTDYLIEGAVKALLVNGERVIKSPDDLNARAEIQWLASIAHNNLLDTGRIADWGSHRIEHELSAQYGITHGEGMAVVLVAWTKFAATEKPWKLSQLATRVFGVDSYNHSESECAAKLSAELEKFFRLLNLHTTLNELGIDNKDFNAMANRATVNGTKTVGHYIPLDKAKFVSVLNLAL